MSEPMLAEIWIGGKISRSKPSVTDPEKSQFEAFVDALENDWRLWADNEQPSRDKILQLINDSQNQEIYISSSQADWGEFDIEEFLQAEKIPYDRKTEAKDEWPTEEFQFRQDTCLKYDCSINRNELIPIINDIQDIVNSPDKTRKGDLKVILGKLLHICPEDLYDLPKLEIVD